ncbi:tetratricopeptide repeat protein [Methylophilus sp. YYY-1]|uniref:tetratricopeptide repeat protein n=1 Tax=Methylophilus sp. YYY-1 TaxID=2682087 RepID=UPI0023B2CA4A|nr:tetratricopeptide repeat protein [Methylophilus sp. YYY-1]MDF0377114.1 tetratricopeptide repeat protein [Methylophilus sp. YYY-1]
MPPRSRYSFGEYRKNANKIFTNRESFLGYFDQFRNKLETGKHCLLTFYGVGGEGKSALCRKLIETLRDENPKTTALGIVDFSVETHRRADRALLELRKSLRKYSNGRIKFPAFEIAILHYWEKEYPELNLRDSLKDVFDDNEDTIASFADNLKDWTDYAEDLPAGIGLSVKFANYIRHKAKEAYFKRANESLSNLEQLENHQLLQKLPYIFASDILAHLELENSLDVVLFLDTYEALWEHNEVKTGIGALEKDNWIKDLVRELPGALFVIFGRERLTWDIDFPDEWAGYLENQYQLYGLKDEDADKYLQLIPIHVASIRAAIIQGAKGESREELSPEKNGAHPFYLELATDLYLSLLDEGKLAEAEDIGKTPRDVLERFLKYRSKEEIETLRVLSIAYSFDQSLFESLVNHFNTCFPLTAFSDFITYSFIYHGQDGRYYIHGLMREHLSLTLDQPTFLKIKDFLFKYYNALLPASVKDVSVEHEFQLQQAFRHLNWEQPEHIIDWYNDHYLLFYEAAKYELLMPMALKMLQFSEQSFPTFTPLIAIHLDNLGRLYQELGRYNEAEPLYKRALDLRKKNVGADGVPVDFALSHLASGFNNLALLYEKLNRDEDALSMYKSALEIHKKNLSRKYDINLAGILNNIAEIYKKINQYEFAENYYLESLALYNEILAADHSDIRDTLNIANTINNLASLYKRQGRFSESEILFENSLNILEKNLPSDHPYIARVLHNLSGLYASQNKPLKAKPLLEKALSMRIKNLPSGHPDLVESIECLKILNAMLNK